MKKIYLQNCFCEPEYFEDSFRIATFNISQHTMDYSAIFAAELISDYSSIALTYLHISLDSNQIMK